MGNKPDLLVVCSLLIVGSLINHCRLCNGFALCFLYLHFRRVSSLNNLIHDFSFDGRLIHT